LRAEAKAKAQAATAKKKLSQKTGSPKRHQPPLVPDATASTEKTEKRKSGRSGLTPEGRARLLELMKARWAARKARVQKKAKRKGKVAAEPAVDVSLEKDLAVLDEMDREGQELTAISVMEKLKLEKSQEAVWLIARWRKARGGDLWDIILKTKEHVQMPNEVFMGICEGFAVDPNGDDKGSAESLQAIDDAIEQWSREQCGAEPPVKDDELEALRSRFKAGDKISVAKIQTKLKIGYQAASALMDQLVDAGEVKDGAMVERGRIASADV
jgi:hypothetical protein